jgi:hypothetical protein
MENDSDHMLLSLLPLLSPVDGLDFRIECNNVFAENCFLLLQILGSYLCSFFPFIISSITSITFNEFDNDYV